ncbi:unnamed protein product [Mytilus edulis]|uniref:Peptidase A2 domain-containing protein n=1 Tax=Mytilus edulis TaxID=6550 RepID=A0A8S3V646_MYTED|nr:unnamed protein product [Mytilus edulis]
MAKLFPDEMDEFMSKMNGLENPSQSTPRLPSHRLSYDFMEESGYASGRPSTESELIDCDIRKLKEQLEQLESFKEPTEDRLYPNLLDDNKDYVPSGVTVRSKYRSTDTKRNNEPIMKTDDKNLRQNNSTSVRVKPATYEAVALRGQAQGILGDLPIDKQQNYKALVNALEQRFAPPNQTELYRVQLTERRQKASESLPELGQSIRRLINQAYPTVPEDVRDTLAKQYFIEALTDSEMRIRIKQSRPHGLNDALRVAVELETYNRAEKQLKDGRSYLRQASQTEEKESHIDRNENSDHIALTELMSKMEQKLQELQKDMRELKNDSNSRQTEEPRSQNNNGRGRFNRGGFRQRRGRYDNGGRGFYGNTNGNRDKSYNGQSNYNSFNDSRGRGTTRMLKSSQNQKNGLHGNIGVSTAAHAAGMYVDTDLYGLSASLMVDTGATVTIISEKTYNKIPRARQPDLMSSNQQVFTASGDQLKIVGKGSFHLVFQHGKSVVVEAIVAQITIDGILGLDFMKTIKGKIDLEKNSFEIDGTQVMLKYEGIFGCFRVMPKIKTTHRSQHQKCPYKTLDTDDLKEHLVDIDKKVHVKDEPKGKVIIPDIDLSSDTDECLRKDPGQIIGPISTGEETNSDENNNEDETNKNDTKIEANQKVEEAIKHDKVGQIIEGMKQAGRVAVQENNKEVKSSTIVREDVEVEAYKLSPKDLRHVIPRAPTKVVNSDKGVEIGTQASALTTVRRTVTTKTTYEENGRNVEIIEVVEQVL